MKTIKIICLYQVIMHYRIPFYEKLSNDEHFDFKLLYGTGKPGTKLINANFDSSKINAEQLKDVRIPLPFTPKLFPKLIKENPDIVFSEGASSLINASIAFIYSKIFNKKFIWWSLGKLKNKKNSPLRSIIGIWESIIEKKSDAIFTYSTQGKEYFVSKGIPAEKIFVAVNVFDTEKKLAEINQDYDENFLDQSFFNIGFIGTIEKTKNLELLVKTVNKLNSNYENNIRLHIIGDGAHMEELKQNIQGHDQEVIFYGRMNKGASKILKNCDVMVLPGLGGLAIVEGMLNSLPIITGTADGTELDLVSKDNGFVIEKMQLPNLYEAIEKLIKNPVMKKQMGEKSFFLITQKYNFQSYYRVFQKMIDVIK